MTKGRKARFSNNQVGCNCIIFW